METINTLKDNRIIPTFTATECKKWVDKIFKLRDHWTERTVPQMNLPVVYWTLGLATYFDGPEGFSRAANNGSNKMLLENFKPLYDKTIGELKKNLEANVYIDPENYTIPGFHLHRGGDDFLPLGLAGGGTLHRDTPHVRAEFSFPYSNILSFTLPLSLPKAGGGLNHWPDEPANIVVDRWYFNCNEETRKWLEENVKYIPYKVGEMVVHHCNILHQVANLVKTTPDDWRITVQGHGVLTEKGWLIYF